MMGVGLWCGWWVWGCGAGDDGSGAVVRVVMGVGLWCGW